MLIFVFCTEYWPTETECGSTDVDSKNVMNWYVSIWFNLCSIVISLKYYFLLSIEVCFSWPCVVLGGWVTYNLQEQISPLCFIWFFGLTYEFLDIVPLLIINLLLHKLWLLDWWHVQEFVELCLEIFAFIFHRTQNNPVIKMTFIWQLFF
jgi:hypothetical protein